MAEFLTVETAHNFLFPLWFEADFGFSEFYSVGDELLGSCLRVDCHFSDWHIFYQVSVEEAAYAAVVAARDSFYFFCEKVVVAWLWQVSCHEFDLSSFVLS